MKAWIKDDNDGAGMCITCIPEGVEEVEALHEWLEDNAKFLGWGGVKIKFASTPATLNGVI